MPELSGWRGNGAGHAVVSSVRRRPLRGAAAGAEEGYWAVSGL